MSVSVTTSSIPFPSLVYKGPIDVQTVREDRWKGAKRLGPIPRTSRTPHRVSVNFLNYIEPNVECRRISEDHETPVRRQTGHSAL